MKLVLRMAINLDLDEDFILDCIEHNDRYKKFLVPKKNGNYRKVLQPSKELKTLQYWMLKNVLQCFPKSKYSSAYSKGDSIKRNAYVHRNARYILHTDISNFFPSINRDMLLVFFERNKDICRQLELDEEDINVIADIVLYKGRELVIGSVASPTIANIIMNEFDEELANSILGQDKFRYTRYADDIIISSMEFIDNAFIDEIDRLLESKGFSRNREKTYFMNKKCRRKVTGIVLDNNENMLSIGHRRYKLLKKEIYSLLIKEQGDTDHVKGYLAFVKDINPKTYHQLKNIYKKYDKKGKLF